MEFLDPEHINFVVVANSLFEEGSRRTDETEDLALMNALKAAAREYDPEKDWIEIKNTKTKFTR